MNLSEINKIHFIGIGGIGMSALARLFLHDKKQVTGSDSQQSEITEKLRAEGATVSYAQGADNITHGGQTPLPDLVVYTEAIAKNNPELMSARALNIKTINYFDALGLVANQYYLIAVSGSHGKSTTTAMLIDILEEAGLDPTAVVGSLRSKSGSNFRAGKSKYMVVEACEYKRDFLSLKPDVLIITNIEHEHVDYYHDLKAVQDAFQALARQVSEDGAIVCDVSDTQVSPVIKELQNKLDGPEVIDYRKYFDVSLKMHTPGLHNRLNAAAATAAACFVGVETNVSNQALENFAGIWRRFEYKGDYNNAKIYDDYAHHPTEIRAAIAGARELYPDKKLTVVYQPHTYSRTIGLFDDFVSALALADRVIMVPIYAARETNESGVSSEQIAEKIQAGGTPTEYFHTLAAAGLAIKESVGPDDVVIIMGAGDVTKIASGLTKQF